MSALSLIKRIQEEAQTAQLKGNLVYWTITGFEAPYADVVEAFEQVGLPSDLVREVSSKSALNKAIRANTQGVKGSHHRKVVDNDDRAGFAILNTAVVDTEALDLRTETTTKAVLNKHTKTVQVEGERAVDVQNAYLRFKTTYTSDQFRTAVLRVLIKHAQGVSLRENGGVYFVPVTHTGVLERVRSLFTRFSGCTLFVIPIIDSKDSRQAIWHSLESEVTEALAELDTDIESLNGQLSERSREIRLSRYAEIRQKVENYAFLLSGTAHGMTTKLDGITHKLMSKLTSS
jgi:hypothetical protein